jgi:hypothetical protein
MFVTPFTEERAHVEIPDGNTADAATAALSRERYTPGRERVIADGIGHPALRAPGITD